MNHDNSKYLNLGSLGTIWTLTRFSLHSLYAIKTYQSGHQNPGETQRQKNFKFQKRNLGSLGTIWALTRFGLYSLYAINTYESGHQNPGETQRQNILEHQGGQP